MRAADPGDVSRGLCTLVSDLNLSVVERKALRPNVNIVTACGHIESGERSQAMLLDPAELR